MTTRIHEIQERYEDGSVHPDTLNHAQTMLNDITYLLDMYFVEKRAAIAAGLAMEAMREELERVKREREELRATALAGLAQITDGLEALSKGVK